MQIFLCSGLSLPICKARLLFTITACRRLALRACGRHLIYFFCFSFMLFGCAQAQSPNSGAANGLANIRPLQIGEDIPDELWNKPLQVVNDPEGRETITLADYKGKLIILDFWATWCVPCIRNFPKLHALQNEFGDKIKVLAITQEDTDRIIKFFQTGTGTEHTHIHSVINDNVLSSVFPHKAVPHIAWINPHGKVLNTTTAEDITSENIKAILDNENPKMTGKVDIDRTRPLFLSEHFSDQTELKAYSIFFKGYYPGLPSGNNVKRTKDGKIYGRQMTNATMMDIYRPIASHIFDANGEKFNAKRIMFEVEDPALLNLIKKSDSGYETSNLNSYELIVPIDRADSLYYYMLEDLNRYSDYTAHIEKREVDCVVLVRTSGEDKIQSQGGKPKNTFPSENPVLINHPISHMLTMLNGDTLIKLPIIDETGYAAHVDIKISGGINLVNLKKELRQYDLDLVVTKRKLNMFILTDK